MLNPITRAEAKAQVTEMAVTIKVRVARNTLTFATLFQAEQAAELLRRGGISCNWVGGNQPALTTAADFPAKEA